MLTSGLFRLAEKFFKAYFATEAFLMQVGSVSVFLEACFLFLGCLGRRHGSTAVTHTSVTQSWIFACVFVSGMLCLAVCCPMGLNQVQAL